LRHLPVGGRWIELGYPKARWEREGRMIETEWGSKTEGGGIRYRALSGISQVRLQLVRPGSPDLRGRVLRAPEITARSTSPWSASRC
jgi:hypothetical protein